MSIPRPLTKPMLKKLFLKSLNEFLSPQGRFKDHAWGADSVINCLPQIFGIAPLSGEEKTLAWRAVYELERDGFIQGDHGQNSVVFKVFMERGRRFVAEELDQMELGWIDIDELLSHDRLKSKIRDDYVEGDFESCVFKAFRLLEEEVRTKAGQGPGVLGTTLMANAFKVGGVLKHPESAVDSETEGLHALMRGAIGWFKNPASHRTVTHNDPQKSAQILAFADYLLTLLDECNT